MLNIGFTNTQASDDEDKVPNFKRSKHDQGYADIDLLELHYSEVITKFPMHVRKLLAWASSSDEPLFLSTISRNSLVPPRRKESLSGISSTCKYTTWRARVFLHHLQKKGLGEVVDLYENRAPRNRKPYFLVTSWDSMSAELREELNFSDFPDIEPLNENYFW